MTHLTFYYYSYLVFIEANYRKKHVLLTLSGSFQNFYKTELNKEEMYIRYIHKLYELHLKAQNYTGNNRSTYLCRSVSFSFFTVISAQINLK